MAMIVASLICGLIFGVGLVISGMSQPAKVLGFLDLLGKWDPTLLFVMASAVAVSALGFAFAKRRGAPILGNASAAQLRKEIDRPLVVGAILFGIGWGIAGLCPGPAFVNLLSSLPALIVFVAAMFAGMALHDVWWRRRPVQARPGSGPLASTDG